MTVYAELRSVIYFGKRMPSSSRPMPTGKSNAGTSALKLIASGLVARFPSRMPHDLLNASLTITTLCGCIRPSAMLPRPMGLPGRHLDIFAERDRKLELARQNRKIKRQSLAKSIIASTS